MQVLQMKPDVPAWRKDLGEQFLMSLRAEIKLRRKGLAYTKRMAANGCQTRRASCRCAMILAADKTWRTMRQPKHWAG